MSFLGKPPRQILGSWGKFPKLACFWPAYLADIHFYKFLMWGVANLALTPSLINCLDHFLKWEMISCQRKSICRATALEAYPPHNGVLVWCSNTNNILLCVAPIRHSPRHHLWSFVHQVANNTLGTDISGRETKCIKLGCNWAWKGLGSKSAHSFQ